ncbi:MAG TPA: UDP-glucose--hexose-1-phosphate uridylyltransferase [Candidatus Ruthenibacterium merdigallinarum]|nr:UDP-glucose--hexose-1-phosphate uridylyltransferase [Candidatus Ruthenibacterium merdigallinarum]
MNNTALSIERLLRFALERRMLAPLDVYVARNTLLDLFGLAQPWEGEVPEEHFDTPTELLELLLDDAAELGLFDNEVPALRVNFEARIMGAVMPREGEVAAKFAQLWQTGGAKAATDYFYDLCIVSNYIRTAQIAKNIKWTYPCQYGELEITINLTKPEKDPKTIALERMLPAASYPKCMLCIENIGYAGRVNFPARQNHRVVPVSLCGEEWFLQYSPYVYYNEHCIVFDSQHSPMHISAKTFAQLFDFVRQFPHYTCGSNADLPIVGGSILSHMHFQGGRYEFPMQRAQTLASFKNPAFPDIAIHTVRWPVSTVRVVGHDAQQMLAFAEQALGVWRGYSDPSADILAYSEKDGAQVPHNTITPILRYDSEQGYILDLVPRNNRTSEEYPEGIFHPHRELHNIKKENIGLIEVMGLAILPGRLQAQGAAVANVLCGKLDAEKAKADMPVHADWIDELCAKYGTSLSPAKAADAVHTEIGAKFEACLEHAGVFKQTPQGQAAFARFLAKLGCEPV